MVIFIIVLTKDLYQTQQFNKTKKKTNKQKNMELLLIFLNQGRAGGWRVNINTNINHEIDQFKMGYCKENSRKIIL